MARLRSDLVPNNLPVVLSSFVGRERELAELGGLLGEVFKKLDVRNRAELSARATRQDTTAER